MKDILKAKRPFDVIVKHPNKNIEIRRRAMVVANFRGSNHVIITRAIETDDKNGWFLDDDSIEQIQKEPTSVPLYNLNTLPINERRFYWSYGVEEIIRVIYPSNITITFGVK